MNDVTKARHFLKTNGSDLQYLESFALMLATAERRYKDIQMKYRSASPFPISSNLAEKEAEAALEYAALRYLKNHNQLPKNASSAFRQGVTAEEKLSLAQEWVKA